MKFKLMTFFMLVFVFLLFVSCSKQQSINSNEEGQFVTDIPKVIINPSPMPTDLSDKSVDFNSIVENNKDLDNRAHLEFYEEFDKYNSSSDRFKGFIISEIWIDGEPYYQLYNKEKDVKIVVDESQKNAVIYHNGKSMDYYMDFIFDMGTTYATIELGDVTGDDKDDLIIYHQYGGTGISDELCNVIDLSTMTECKLENYFTELSSKIKIEPIKVDDNNNLIFRVTDVEGVVRYGIIESVEGVSSAELNDYSSIYEYIIPVVESANYDKNCINVNIYFYFMGTIYLYGSIHSELFYNSMTNTFELSNEFNIGIDEIEYDENLNSVLINNTIYRYDGVNFDDIPENGSLPDLIYIAPYMDEIQQTTLIKIYLQERGINKELPDDVISYNGKNIAEYYLDDKKRKICCIFHRFEYEPEDGIYCVTLNLDNMEKIGNVSFHSDQKKETFYESLYDADGKQVAQTTYRYIVNNPFPLITEYEAMNNDMKSYSDLLLRGQIFRIYEEMAEFDNYGKWLEYDGGIIQPENMNTHYVCSYDKSGKLDHIIGNISLTDLQMSCDKETLNEFTNTDESEIKLIYRENGMLDSVVYERAPELYGSFGSAGKIYYDEEGRMIYEETYQTSGAKYRFYLYNDGEREPWASIYIDSMPYSSSSRDGIDYDYGNYYSIYYFAPDNSN